ncbi:Flp family type IVb pilin [Methylobacterium terricola]|uniref:Flp family type IVb pilin n=1 Tax=Methylobacterium terricola TaxID=2583531 RepID=UPI001FEA3937|nr:Flp family type IVb pilin [Methylobacterium terricola]
MQGRSREGDALRRFRRDQSGTTAIEYALIAGLIFLALTTALSAYGDTAGSLYNNLSTRFLAALK